MQNKIFKLFLFIAAIALTVLSSCTKKIDDAYANPNAPVVVPIETILPGVIGGFTLSNLIKSNNTGGELSDTKHRAVDHAYAKII